MRTLSTSEKARAVREGAARQGVSLLELGSKTGHSPENLAAGVCNLWHVAETLGYTDEQMFEMGHD